jgi:hypothetical protein
MAADLNIKIGVDGGAAISNAKQVGDALKQMGASGDTAGKQIIDVNIRLSQAMKQATTNAAAEAGEVTKLGHAMEATSGHASRMGQNIMYAERGAHDILTTFGLASGSANLVGRLARGVDDLMLSVARGGAGMLAFAGSMIAFSVAMKALTSVMDLFKDAMKSAGEEEKLGIAIKDVVGSSKLAQHEMEQLKDFVTGPFAGALKLDDVAEGVRKLQLLTGQLTISDAQLKAISTTAQLNHTTFLAVATQYGKVIEAIRVGNPVRAQLLTTMVGEGLITAQTQAKIETLVKAHADLKTVMAALTEGMKGSEQTNNALANSYDNIVERLGKILDIDIAAPFGAAIERALKEPLKAFGDMLAGQKGNIETMANNLSDTLIGTINYVKEVGFAAAWKEIGGSLWQTYIAEPIKGWWKDQVEQFKTDWQNITPKWLGGTGKIGEEAGKTGAGLAIPNIDKPVMDALTAGWADIEKTATPIMDRIGKAFLKVLSQLQTAEWWDNVATAFVTAIGRAGDAIGTAIHDAVFGGLTKGPIVGPMNIPGRQDPTRQGVYGLDAGQQKLLDEQKKIQDDQKAAIKANEDQVKKNTDTASELKAAEDRSKIALEGTINALNALKSTIQNWSPQGGAAFGGAFPTGQPPFPGAERIMSEWKPGEPMTRANQIGAFGKQLQLGDIGGSIEKLIAMFGSLAASEGKYVDIRDRYGNIMVAHLRVMETSWLNNPTRPSGGWEVWGRPDLGWGRVTPSTSVPTSVGFGVPTTPITGKTAKTQQDYIDEARRQREAAQADQAAKAGAATPVPPKEKKTKELTEEKQLTDQLRETTEKYSVQLSLIEEKKKAHIITNAEAAKQSQAQYQAEFNDLTQLKSKMDAAEQAATAAHDTKKAEAYRMEIVKIETELVKLKGHLDTISATSTFGGQFQAEATKQFQNLEFTGTKAVDAIKSGLDSIGQGFTSIIDGSAKASDAFKQMAKSIIDQLAKIGWEIIESQIMKMIGSIGGGIGGGLGGAAGLAAPTGLAITGQHGGLVSGPSGVDKVPGMLTAGEYVLTNRAVDKYGIKMIDAMNKGTWGHFAAGGFVTPGTSTQNIPPSQNISGAGGVQNVMVSTTVNLGGPTSAPGQPAGAGGSMSKEQIAQFQTVINNVVKQQIAVEKRPGGLLNRNSGG